MTTTLKSMEVRAHNDDLLRAARRHRSHGELRRLAVIRATASQFKLLPRRAAI